MKIHHLNCGTCCPAGGRLFDGTTDAARARIVCHCLLIESDRGLILVDTGFGTRDIANQHHRLSNFFLDLNQPQLRPDETALAQVKALGFAAEDVRHILITHLDFDHAGGLEDFPNATVYLTAREKEVADQRKGGVFVGTRRYRPGQWDDVESWKLYPFGGGEAWFGFDCVRDLDGLPPEILLVPLAGHTWGHSGVAIREDGGGWLLHAGDAYYLRAELDRDDHPVSALTARRADDNPRRVASLEHLRRLAREHRDEIDLVGYHDFAEFPPATP